MLIQEKLQKLANEGLDSSSIVAAFLLREKSQVIHMSMQQIAQATNTSKPSLVRIAKSLGFTGWSEFQRQYVDELYRTETRFQHVDAGLPFDSTDDIASVIQKLTGLILESVTHTAFSIEQDQMQKAVDFLMQARRIVVFGLTPHTMLAEMFQRKMLFIGKAVEIPKQTDHSYAAAAMSAQDCAIMISYSGNSPKRNPMRSLKYLKQNHVPIVALTGQGGKLLRREADCTLTIAGIDEAMTQVANYRVETSVSFLLNALYSCYFIQDYQGFLRYKNENYQRITSDTAFFEQEKKKQTAPTPTQQADAENKP